MWEITTYLYSESEKVPESQRMDQFKPQLLTIFEFNLCVKNREKYPPQNPALYFLMSLSVNSLKLTDASFTVMAVEIERSTTLVHSSWIFNIIIGTTDRLFLLYYNLRSSFQGSDLPQKICNLVKPLC